MSLAWTQKVKCEVKESSLYEQFTIYFFNMFVAREGREWPEHEYLVLGIVGSNGAPALCLEFEARLLAWYC